MNSDTPRLQGLHYCCILLAVFSLFTSCNTTKKLVYFPDLGSQGNLSSARAPFPSIRSSDLLEVEIYSTNSKSNELFNSHPLPGLSSYLSPEEKGYLVDENGYIELPTLGRVKVGGLSLNAARDTLSNRSRQYLKEPIVSLHLLNFTVSVLGEVNKPDVYAAVNDQLTLPEALSRAGDLTPIAKRNNVLIIRSQENRKEYGRVNLQSSDLFRSPYYYLQKNDIIYVTPAKNKASDKSTFLSVLAIVASGLYTVIALTGRRL